MKSAKLFVLLVLTVFALTPLSSSIAKEDDSWHKVHKCECKSYVKHDKDHKDDCSLKDKFFKKTRFILKKADKIGLSDEQVKQIIDLKIATKKALITQKAEIKLAKLDVKVALKQKPINLATVKELIGKKYELKKQKAQNLAEAYVKLKGILSDSQKAKAKEIWLESKEKEKKDDD